MRLPCHCDEGEQDSDDGFLVHVRFVFYFIFLNRANSLFNGSTLFPYIFFDFFPVIENDDSHCIQTSFDDFPFPIIYAVAKYHV